jgi:pimeloyl-ACP methyl ester carboxylesterase
MSAVPLPFHPRDPAFSLANALYLAHAADVAYHRAPVAAAWDRLGLRATPFRHKVTRTRGFVGVCDTHAVLAFRGSDPVTLQTWLTDAVVRLVERPDYPGRVHLGFASALRRTWALIEPALDAAGDRPLFLTGHSMGGALAVLTAARLARAGRPAVATYTFGAPRVGDPAFCAAHALPTYRVVNRLDLVPEVPLASLRKWLPKTPRLTNDKVLAKLHALADRVPCYGHVDTLVHIDRDGVVTPNADVQPWHVHAVARALATRGRSFHEGITDHLITHYIRGLQGHVGQRQTGVRAGPSRTKG